MWVETKTNDSKSYYYHAVTRETTWSRPVEGPHVKVMTQPEFETYSKQQIKPMEQKPDLGDPSKLG